MKPEHTDEKILQYLDGQTAMQEKRVFEEALKSDPQLEERFQQLKLVHDTLRHGKLEMPSANFTNRVMSNLAKVPAGLNLSSKNGLMLLLGVTVAMLLGAVFLSSGWFNQLSGVISLDKVTMPNKIIKQPLPSIPFDAVLVMKVLIGVCLAIAFVLIDKAVLQPYFRKRTLSRIEG